MKAFLEEKVLPVVLKFTQMRYMQVIMNAFMGISAISIAGSLFTLIKSIPFDPWLKFLESSGIGTLLSIPVAITTDAISLYLVFSIAYHTAKSFNQDGFSPALVSVGAFLLLTPFETTAISVDATGNTVYTAVSNVIPLSSIGASGMFLAMIVGIVATRVYIFAVQKGWRIKMPDSVPQNVSGMFEAMVPGGLVFVIFLLMRYGMAQTSYGTAQSLIYGVLQTPLTKVGGGIPGILMFLVASNTLWLFGVHGGMVAYVAMAPIFSLMGTENTVAFAAGKAAPHPEWAMTAWTTMGGGGATLALSILLLTAKSSHYKTLGKMALPTSLFHINEPITFGVPVIMNPYLAVPFFATPLINFFLTYGVMNLGLVRWPTGAGINGFMPFGIQGMLINAHWSGLVWSIALLAIDLVIWFPFFKALDNKTYKEEQLALNK